ncbi:MAG: site-2 protease family protein [Clostridia bacterium]|nr:site-2 protease family protein [Clostridia bacterium]
MFDGIKGYIIELMLSLPGIIFAMTVHEYAHALVSTKLGDPLPKASGRLTLNPFKHLDPVGFLMLLVLRFGWARPVYIDPRYYKKPRRDRALTSFAGPAANFITAFILVLVQVIMNIIYARVAGGLSSFALTAISVAYTMLDITVIISVGLGLFNLIPVPPLDGSGVLFSFLPLKLREKLRQAERYGIVVLMLLMFNVPGRLLGIIGVPSAITMWLDLSLYLGIARSAIIGAFQWFWEFLFSVII